MNDLVSQVIVAKVKKAPALSKAKQRIPVDSMANARPKERDVNSSPGR